MIEAELEPTKPLSIREESVLSLTCAGLNDKEISARLGIGVETVRTYWSRIKEKLQVETRSEALVASTNRDMSNVVRAHETENRYLLDEIQRRKTAERLLAESEARFKSFCEISNLGMFLADTRGNCTYANPECLRTLSVDPTEAEGACWRKLAWSPAMLRRIRKAMLELKEKGSHRGRYSLNSSDGRREFRVSIRPVYHHYGLAGYIGVVEDVSESVVLRREVEAATQFCTCVSAATDDIVYVFETATGTVLSVNHASEALFGMTSEEIRLLGPGALAKCIDPADHQQLAQLEKGYSALADGEAIKLRCRAIAADGSTPMLEGRVVVYRRDDVGMPSQMLGVLKILRDA